MEFLSAELLSDAAKSSLVQNLIVFGIMWRVIKKTVATHFDKIENSLNSISVSLERLRVEHGSRIDRLEKTITNNNKER